MGKFPLGGGPAPGKDRKPFATTPGNPLFGATLGSPCPSRTVLRPNFGAAGCTSSLGAVHRLRHRVRRRLLLRGGGGGGAAEAPRTVREATSSPAAPNPVDPHPRRRPNLLQGLASIRSSRRSRAPPLQRPCPLSSLSFARSAPRNAPQSSLSFVRSLTPSLRMARVVFTLPTLRSSVLLNLRTRTPLPP